MKIGFSALTESSYGAIPHCQNQLMAGIQQAGGSPVSCMNLEDTIGLDAFVLINSVPLAIQEQIFHNVRQYWTYLLDAPFHHANWISAGPSFTTYAVVDPTHLALLFQLGRTGVFLPHGGDTHPFRPWKDREIDVLFTGTAPQVKRSYEHLGILSPELRGMAEQLIRESLVSPQHSLLDLLIALLKDSGTNLEIDDAMSVMTEADHIIRATQRHNLIQAFSDFSVVVAGRGWDEVDLSPNHRWIGEVPYEELSDLMSRAKVILCPTCGFTQGAHDRTLSAMGCGAVALTPTTTFLSQHFEHGVHLAYFNQLQEARDLGRLILNGTHWEVVGEAGHKMVADRHSWIHRGRELFSHLQGKRREGDAGSSYSELTTNSI